MTIVIRIRDSTRVVEELKAAGFRYTGLGAWEAGKKESLRNGYFHHPPQNSRDARSRSEALRHNVATLWYGNEMRLVHEDEPGFPAYHDQIQELLRRKGLIQE